MLVVALLFGCNHSRDATSPVLKTIELYERVYLARVEHRITVSPDGTLRSVRTEGKSYGTNDVDPKYERVEVRQGVLDPDQAAELARLFAAWDDLASTPYSGAPDGGDVSIRYGDKMVSGGSGVPHQVTAVRARLFELARLMPVVK